ncbi:hypothetical protein [Hymenobacter mucosus]|uniref:Uncharacterized protein n=1 Tax=Hymenobacter mucosus TaxID=1411120 RepID=A0A239ABL0_9BACT|nr:hypothetical protein [Hymenobacter mucosus]SNR92721.1 hypothetical protein SAMN06269173_111117 [Hymenobacter mucosus]
MATENRKISEFQYKSELDATDFIPGIDLENPDPAKQNVKYPPTAVARYVNPLFQRANASQVQIGLEQRDNQEQDGYTVVELLAPVGGAALGLYFSYDSASQLQKRLVYTHSYTGNPYTTEWNEMGGERSARRFTSTRDYQQDELVRYAIAGQDRFFSATQELLRTNYDGGEVPAPTGLLDDVNWQEVSGAAPAPLFVVADEAFVQAQALLGKLVPGLLYRITNRVDDPLVDVLAVAFTSSAFAAQEAYEVASDANEPLFPVAYALSTGLTSARMGGAGGGESTFLADIPVSLSNGKTLGKYPNGSTIPALGKSFEQVLRDIAIEDIYPTYSTASESIQQSAASDGEVGESLPNTLTARFNQGDAGALEEHRIYLNDQLVEGGADFDNPFSVQVNMTRTLAPQRIYARADYAAGPRKPVLPSGRLDERTPQVRNSSAPQAAEANLQSGTLFFSGRWKSYVGTSTATSLDMAGLLALGGGVLQSGRSRTVTGVTAASGQYLYYAYEASAGDLTNIILDGAAPVLGAFQKLADVRGQNVHGVPVTMRVYRSNAPNAFLNNSLAFS